MPTPIKELDIFQFLLVCCQEKVQKPIITAFAHCSSVRLFLPQILPEYNYILYMDTDILFLQDPFEIWKNLQKMEQKSFGVVSENDDAL